MTSYNKEFTTIFFTNVVLPVPLIVNHLKLRNNGNTDRLKASWERPHGDLDFYHLQLFCHKQAVFNISVLTNTTSIVLPFQRPGTLYKLLVTSVSGTQMSKYAEAECRTGIERYNIYYIFDLLYCIVYYIYNTIYILYMPHVFL